jgi:hypothetical protein
MDLFAFVVPVQGNTNILISRPVIGYFVVLFQSIREVESMFLTNIFVTKIINYKGELDRPLIMLP